MIRLIALCSCQHLGIIGIFHLWISWHMYSLHIILGMFVVVFLWFSMVWSLMRKRPSYFDDL